MKWSMETVNMGQILDCLHPKNKICPLPFSKASFLFLAGVWTQFDDLCHLQNKKQWDIQNFSLAWSSDSQDIIGYVVKEFHQKSRKDFTDLERKIECYIHCSKALTKSDVVEKKTTEVCCKEEVCNECPASQ